MNIKSLLLKLLLPSSWIEWLKGKKRFLGVVALVLWAMIYVVPELYPELAFLGPLGLQIQAFLASQGLDMGHELFAAGAGLTALGFLDWALKHVITTGLVKVTGAVERLVSLGRLHSASNSTGN